MAKYNIKMSCGHEEVHNLTGKTDRIKWQIGQFEQFGICKECFLKQKEAENKKIGLVLKANLMHDSIYGDNYTLYAEVFFDGDTLPYKDVFKERKYIWGYLDTEYRKMAWHKIIPFDELEEESKKLSDLELTVDINIEEMRQSDFYKQLSQEIQDKREKDRDILNSLEELKKQKPESPDIVRDKRWNYKIYGRENYYSIYLDGDKINLSNEQADILRSYLREKEVYDKKVHDIKMR